jgi:hypothetical protein
VPRLTFDLKPIQLAARDTEDHDAWVREIFERHHPGEEPRPCDCGYFVPDRLVSCSTKDRIHCRAGVTKRLEHHYREEHLKAIRAKRTFPGVPFPRAGQGNCCWCSKPIVHGRVKQRSFHDGRLDEPHCRWEFDVRTRVETQRAHLIERDGLACRDCGRVVGMWADANPGCIMTPERVVSWGAYWQRRYPADVYGDPFIRIFWDTRLEVDHFIALAFAWEAYGDEVDRYRWFFSPRNIRLICHDCHVAKTKADVVLLKQARAGGRDYARRMVLDLLGAAGLLKRTTL